MANYYWLKLWYEMLDDSKIGRLRPALRWRFVECCLVAGERREKGFLPPIPEYAWRVRADAETVETDFVQLAESGLLSQNEGRWFVTNFEKRQAKVDATDRKRAQRERERKEQYYGTPQSPASHDGVTGRDTDTDTDTDKIQIQKAAPNGANAHETMHNMEQPLPPGPAADRADAVQEMVSHIAGAVKTVYAIGKNSDDFERVANALIDYGITTEQVDDFPAWWTENGHYSGRPALKSLLDNIRDAADPLSPVAVDTWGSDAIALD